MYQSKRKNIMKAVFTVFACFCVFCAQGASAHPVTVWPSDSSGPVFRADVPSTLGVTLTVPAPIFTPAMSPSTFQNINVRAFQSGSSSGDAIAVTNVDGAQKMTGSMSVGQSGTIVLASAASSSATSTIMHFSKSFVNVKRDGMITQPFAPKMTENRLEVVPMDDAHKLVKGATMRFQVCYQGEPITGEELETWVEAVAGGDINASPEFNMGFAYVDADDTDEVDMEEGEDYDMRDLDIVAFDFDEGIISVTFNKAAYWSMELYKPRGLEPNTALSQFATLTFEVTEASDSGSSGCNAGFGAYAAALLLCAGGAVIARRRGK